MSDGLEFISALLQTLLQVVVTSNFTRYSFPQSRAAWRHRVPTHRFQFARRDKHWIKIKAAPIPVPPFRRRTFHTLPSVCLSTSGLAGLGSGGDRTCNSCKLQLESYNNDERQFKTSIPQKQFSGNTCIFAWIWKIILPLNSTDFLRW